MNRPWMPLNIADYLRDTSHLRALESGAYLHLIMAYWVGGKLPNDDRQLATIAKLSNGEWRKLRPTLEAFFGEGFSSHKRIDKELAKVAEVSAKRQASVKQRKFRPVSNGNQPDNQNPINGQSNDYTLNISTEERKKKEGSGADAPDVRTRLFSEGLQVLEKITGKTPDSCRALIGKLLKSVNDEAIHVLAAIQDAERNRIADPVPWIMRVLNPKVANGKTPGRSGITAAVDKYIEQFAGERRPESPREPLGENSPRLLSDGRRQ